MVLYESLDPIVRDLTNFRALLEVACDDLADAGMKTIDLKRKVDDAHDRTRSHRDRCRRATKELQTAEEDLNNSLGCLGDLVKDTASVAHALSCGVVDKDSNESKYLRETLDMIDEFQSRRGPETTEVILVERPQ